MGSDDGSHINVRHSAMQLSNEAEEMYDMADC